MTAPSRIPCINPLCRRTAAQERFPDSHEIICGKCFRRLPPSLQRRQRAYWRRHRMLNRLAAKPKYRSRMPQIIAIGEANDRLGQRLWREILAFFVPSGKPAGLDAFLEEMRL